MNIDDHHHLQQPITQIDKDSDQDEEMLTARSDITPSGPKEHVATAPASEIPGDKHEESNEDQKIEQISQQEDTPPPILEIPVTQPSMDLLDRIKGMYRLLEPVSDTATGGSVDKIVIAQESIERLANTIQPNSYSSITKVDFRALDKHAIRPRGIYGSKSSIVEFLGELNLLDPETHSLLLSPRDEASGTNRPFMSPGLYLLDARGIDQDLFYVVFWPEETTWDDDAMSSVSRNRATLMRYLTKLCDQLVCLISEDHAQKLVWGDDSETGDAYMDAEDVEDDVNERLYAFSVEQTQSQEDSATAHDGFSLQHRCISVSKAHNYPSDLSQELLLPRVVVGEQAQGILQVEYNHGEQYRKHINQKFNKQAMIDYLKKHQNHQIQLDEKIPHESLDILLKLGLGSRCGDLETTWRAQLSIDSKKRFQDKEDIKKADAEEIEAKVKKLSDALLIWLPSRAVTFFSSLSEESLIAALIREDSVEHIGAIERQNALDTVEEFFNVVPEYRTKAISNLEQQLKTITQEFNSPYNIAKRHFFYVRYILRNNSELTPQEAQQFLDLLVSNDDFEASFNSLYVSVSSSIAERVQEGGWIVVKALKSLLKKPSNAKPFRLKTWSRQEAVLNDIKFWNELQIAKGESPAYAEAEKLTRGLLTVELAHALKGLQKHSVKNIRQILSKRKIAEREKAFQRQEEVEHKAAWDNLCKSMILSLGSNSDATRPCLRISSVRQEDFSSRTTEDSFRLQGIELKPRIADFRYIFFPMEIKAEDQQALLTNSSHVCKPIINDRCQQAFEIPVGTTLKLFRLVGKERCIVIIQDSETLGIFYESLSAIARSILTGNPTKRVHLSRLGPDILITVDEMRRHLAFLSRSNTSLHIHLYGYEEASKMLTPRGSAVDISKWYPERIPLFHHFLFIPGTEEILLMDSNGTSRIYSLTTQQFRPKTVYLRSRPLSVFATFDGMSLLVVDMDESERLHLRCIHWASFGDQPGTELGISPDILPSTPMGLTSIGNRNNNYLMFLDPDQNRLHSLFIKVTCKSSAFAFKADLDETRNTRRRESKHNSLIDCHTDVWTRFPIAPPIRYESNAQANPHPVSILFFTNQPIPELVQYFRKLVTEFESRTRKPTEGLLRRIQVSTTRLWSPSDTCDQISTSQLGDWLVRLLCLIPIQLAVTNSNRFIPLKDGFLNAEFESQLLGANVMQIVQSLSFGWYESIFSSYLADRPVKVVTSMGEQSVGKSYALNHFVDTSFAGSAMRCTEGVWLSVTPTREYLIVAMDFEGVQSIERSPQEDMLLVLLNTAVSNFVLFRNNFALSRNIAELFTSFQSCINVLDPKSNPQLFQSRLEIIIKDVIASDTGEMVKEFTLKFDRIVQEEGEDNFITKLHKGRIGIIPWPVIESSLFYKLFKSLRTRFMKQSVTHPHGGAFLILLKTLMAKLKANDWGALDQNLAAQRAQHLLSILDNALCFGLSDPSSGEPLKNCDNDQVITTDDRGQHLFLPDITNPEGNRSLDIEACLRDLRLHWNDRLQRYKMSEKQYIESYCLFLNTIVMIRVDLVNQWLMVNTSRFPSTHTDIGTLFRKFDEKVKELKVTVVPCAITCSSCGLLCLRPKYHIDEHNCMTNHKCRDLCEFAEDHQDDDIPACNMPAGHEGRHVCATKLHLCGQLCQMEDRDGCLRRCCKPLSHDDIEHLCAAKVHACGEPCDLITPDGEPICMRKCISDCHRSHERHCCENSYACPIKCQLCGSFCAAGDHFHALESSIHLCGQPHACQEVCQLLGICEIASAPQSVQSMFRGKHSVFSYTKYTQEARKGLCGIQIPPNQLTHEGIHMHTDDPDAFHFCEARCTHCGYFCTLKLGHVDAEHRTQHGSMENAEWLIEGDNDAILELQGRKYATGDSGAPMLCSMVCKSLGRHVHVSRCRAEDSDTCNDPEVEHIQRNDLNADYDWISHKTFWARSGFEDPYTNAESADFELCVQRCGGEEHNSEMNPGAIESYCTLPLFHPPASTADAPVLGHVSYDGHAYNCKNPALLQRSFHVLFALDRSGSMGARDRCPLQDTPVTAMIAQHANNRFGSVVSALYAFWTARDAATRTAVGAGVRQDSYTVVVFNHNPTVICRNNLGSSPDDLLEMVLNNVGKASGGTNFTSALNTIEQEMESSWTSERTPVVIFLSDGQCFVPDDVVYDLCRTAVRLGKPLSLQAVSFGSQAESTSLRRMAAIAKDVYEAAPKDPLSPSGPVPCTFSETLDTVQLADTFLAIAKSLKNPRAALASF